jgi:DsbC/DsbD-like thiol-disulfide interchange protein
MIRQRNFSHSFAVKAYMRLSTTLLFMCIAPCIAPPALAASSTGVDADHLRVTLLSEQDALVPGHSAWLGLHLQHDVHWHTYWINPGDSGLPTRLSWTLPAGFTAADIVWPVPKRFAVGELTNFGYDGDVLLPVQIEVPAQAAAGSSAHLEVQAKWLVCEEACIPGKATLALDLPVRDTATADASVAPLFAAAHAAQPQPGMWKAAASMTADAIEVSIRGGGLGNARMLDAFAVDGKVVGNAAPRFEVRDGAAVLIFAKSDYFTSVPKALHLIVLPPGSPALDVRAFFQPPS